MDQNKILHDPRHLGVPSGASKMILRLRYVRRKPFEPRHLGVPSSASNMISEAMLDLRSIQTDRKELPFEPRHLGVPSSASNMISEAMLDLAQTMQLSCTETNTVSKRSKTSFYLGRDTQEYLLMHPKQFSEPMVCIAQTRHLSCTETNTISETTETRFYMIHVT
jgi:hypothetical protein